MNDQQTVVERLSRLRYAALLQRMQGLFLAAFGRSISAELLAWRYLDNPVGDVLAIVERAQDDSLAASYSAAPVVLSLNGQELRSAISMTTMTAPAYAGKGLFTKLASLLYRDMQTGGYDLVWGFPNANSHNGFISRLEWRDIYEIPTMSLELGGVRTARLPAVDNRVQADSGMTLDYSSIADANPGLITVKRSPEYLRWRYLKHPENEYSVHCVARDKQVSSYCVTKVYQSSAVDIVDLVAASPDEMMLLLARVIEAVREASIGRLNCWAPRHHFCHSVYEKLGFRLGVPITYLGARVLAESRVTWGEVQNFSNWYLQMGDSDVF